MNKKTALITGGGRGIGLAAAEFLLEKGFSVWLSYRGVTPKAQRLLKCKDIIPLPFDVCDPASVKKAKEKMGDMPLYLLINNAGVTRDNLLYSQSEEEWDLVMNTNYTGAVQVYETFRENLLLAPKPAVITISSIAGIRPKKGQGAYAVSKAMIAAWTREMAQYGEMDFYTLSPGPIATDMSRSSLWYSQPGAEKAVPLKRFGTPREVAELIFTLSCPPRFLKNGSNIVFDGGMLQGGGLQ